MPTKLDQKIQEMFSKLPSSYQKAVKAVEVERVIDKIGEDYQLSDKEVARLDREVTYLILHLQGTAQFMLRLEDKLNWSEEKVADITESITDEILRPLQEKLRKITGGNPDNVPVPEPPSQNNEPPKPDYGGRSDPYREPSE